MIVSPLEQPILISPLRDGADELRVLTGYCGAGMVDRHLDQADRVSDGVLKVDLVYGMAGNDGVPKERHQRFREQVLSEYPGRFACSYVVSSPHVHAKLYVWLADGVPMSAFAGSANYTLSAFGANRVELMTPCDPFAALDLIQLHKDRSIECQSIDVESNVVIYEGAEAEYAGLPTVRLPFLDERTGETPMRSGINWGQRLTRDKNQAYLRALVSHVPKGFFPPRGQQFTVRFDDGFEFVAAVAQANDKALHSVESNAIIGQYIRRRMNLKDGEMVTAKHFEIYGRDDIAVFKIDDETYYMDFSV